MARSLLLTASLIAVLGSGARAQAPKDEKAIKADILNAELFMAISARDLSGVKSALTRGADPSGRNWLGMTPLMWSATAGSRPIIDTLLAKGAKLSDTSIYGTALSFAELGRQEAIVIYLLGKGADPNPTRVNGATPLMLAAANGHLKAIPALLAKRCDPNRKDGDGATALIYAARMGQSEACRMLLKAGANAASVDSQGRTALMYGALNGQAAIVDMLVANRATVDAKDKRGATALLLAARYSGSPAVIASLLKSGANKAAEDGAGQTALSLAQSRGYEEAAGILRVAGAPMPGGKNTVPVALTADRAVERSLTAVQTGMDSFAKSARCSSCHHQGMGLMTLGAAQARGFKVDPALLGAYFQRLGEEGKEMGPLIHQALKDPNMAKLAPAADIGDNSVGMAYIFGGVAANHAPMNPGFAEIALYLMTQQAPDGHWGYGFERGPMQNSYVTTTALVLQVLRAYAPKDQVAKTDAVYAKAKQWLLSVPVPTSQDKAARLLGLKLAGAGKEEMAIPLRELIAAQRKDGGWSPTNTLGSDAFATGMAIYALRIAADVPTEDPAIKQGVQFLLRTQDEDGSWFVNKRAMPANNHFDAKFPHGESQYSSFAGTCWATMALLQTTEGVRTSSR